MAKKRAIILALVLWCLVFALGVIYLFSQRNNVLPSAPEVKNAVMQAADNAAAKYEGLSLRPNMLATVAVVFDPKNTLLAYTPVVAKTENDTGIVSEESSFKTPYAEYIYTLTSTEDKTKDTYVTDSLKLEFKGNDVDIIYIDDKADGTLDDVYVNGKGVDDPEFFTAAQDQYTAELIVSRNYLLGLTTSNTK